MHDDGSRPPPGERSPAAVSSSLSDEVMCYGVGTTELVYGMHDPPACGHALVPRQLPRDLSLEIGVMFLTLVLTRHGNPMFVLAS